MEFELRNYQETAARSVLERLEEAVDNYRGKYQRRSSFALSAVMSSGKTVIAAAVIEALFNGSNEFGREADPRAVVLWITDDESLNKQTFQKMYVASELDINQLISIDSPNFPELLATRTIFFLNIQKLYDSSVKYTRSTNARPYTLWDTIRNTINADDRDLYLVLDEAHKGMGDDSGGRSTTVLRLINGEGDRPPIPVVWGISATTERFDRRMLAAIDRTRLPSVEVPIEDVRISGLIKDSVILRRPDKKGQFDTTLLRYGVQKVVEQSKLWNAYCVGQGIPQVVPLLLVQVQNDPPDAEMERVVGTLQEEWRIQADEDLPSDAVAHVFGKRDVVVHAGREVKHVDPETVQENTNIRVLLAKNAVTTGWDCPRAEVLVSFRSSDDPTVITQLMGRMFRTPLARRITEPDVLNTVVCLLPHFNQTKTKAVANMLERGVDSVDDIGSEGEGGGLSVQTGLTEVMSHNDRVPDEVYDLFRMMPSESRPDPKAKPIPRMFSMATALAGDGLLADATDRAYQTLIGVLDGQLAQRQKEVVQAALDIREARIAGLIVNIREGGSTVETDLSPLQGDTRVVDDAFTGASRTFTRAIAVQYMKHRALANRPSEKDDLDFIAAKLQVAALATLKPAGDALNEAASGTVADWLDEFDVAISALGDASKAVYERIREKAPKPMRRRTAVPDGVVEEIASLADNASLYATMDRHLVANDDGQYPIGGLNTWERQVVDTELGRVTPEVLGWYRNPGAPKDTAVRVPYLKADGNWGSFQPDFIFFTRNTDGTVSPSILEPHRDHGDSLLKLRGLADFVERYPNDFGRVEFMQRDEKSVMRKLAVTDPDVRAAIRQAGTAAELFSGPHGKKYL